MAFYTQHDIDLWEDCCARAITAAGGTNEDVCHVSYGYGLFTGGPGLNGGSHKVGCLTLPMSSGNTNKQIMFLQDLGVTLLVATPSYALHLGEQIRERGLGASALWGESDGMGGWHQYFNGGWEPEISYAQAVYELWYSGGKVEAAWNQTDENGFVTGVRVILCTVNLGEEEGHA